MGTITPEQIAYYRKMVAKQIADVTRERIDQGEDTNDYEVILSNLTMMILWLDHSGFRVDFEEWFTSLLFDLDKVI